MTNADVMILAYPVIGAIAVSAAGLGLIYLFGYHRPAIRHAGGPPPSSSTDRTPTAPTSEAAVEGILLKITEAEAGQLLARHLSGAERVTAKITTPSD